MGIRKPEALYQGITNSAMRNSRSKQADAHWEDFLWFEVAGHASGGICGAAGEHWDFALRNIEEKQTVPSA